MKTGVYTKGNFSKQATNNEFYRDSAVHYGCLLFGSVRIPLGCTVLYFSDFSKFSNFVYDFRRILNLCFS